MSFAQMDLVLEGQRMAELVNGIGFSLATSLDHFPHVPEAAIEGVHPAAFDDKPAREGKAKSQFVRLARTARKKKHHVGRERAVPLEIALVRRPPVRQRAVTFAFIKRKRFVDLAEPPLDQLHCFKNALGMPAPSPCASPHS